MTVEDASPNGGTAKSECRLVTLGVARDIKRLVAGNVVDVRCRPALVPRLAFDPGQHTGILTRLGSPREISGEWPHAHTDHTCRR
jgi:hypothetical protein